MEFFGACASGKMVFRKLGPGLTHENPAPKRRPQRYEGTKKPVPWCLCGRLSWDRFLSEPESIFHGFCLIPCVNPEPDQGFHE